MRCARCGTDLVPDKPFCHACGAPAPVRCTGCARTIDPGFRFCPDCGTEVPPGIPQESSSPASARGDPFRRFSREIPSALLEKIEASRGSLSGERKIVTVFFCDLVGSTGIAEELDPEEYRDLLDRYLEIAFREVYRFDGIVNQLAGDGFMALFGAPVAHEDAPARAVHAALAIREALQRLAERERRKRAVELELRIGIHTGPVVVGAVGNDLKMDYTAIGDTTNLGARLQSLADPGKILISEATSRSVRGLFRLHPAGDLPVRGRAEPIRAYEVTGAREAVTPIAAAEARGLTPLVGRTEELAQLQACFERSRRGLGQVVAVVGEAGTGRSRLIYEFRRRLRQDDCVILEGRSSSLTQKVPYAPFAMMWRSFFGLSGKDATEEACRKISERLRKFTDDPEGILPYMCRLLSIPGGEESDLPREELLRATFEALTHLVAGISHKSPVVMVLEDLHWADDSSQELLKLSLARLGRARVMLVVSHRPDFPFAATGQAVYTRIHLRRLAREDVAEVIRAVAGGPLPAELESLIDLKGEGVPFFVEEITRSLLEDGSLRKENGELHLTRPVSELRIPGTVEELIGARLDRLGPEAKRVVQMASVLGRQLRRDHLHALLAGEGIDVDRELDRLESLGILHRKTLSSADEYRFGESLTQEVAYQSLLLKERRRLHERIGLLLEEETEEPTVEQSALRAHHLALSENREKALHALLEAGDEAAELPSYHAAYDCYREAWDVGEALLREREERCPEILRAIVRAANGLARLAVFYRTNDPDESERAATRAHELAEELDDVEAAAFALSARGMIVYTAYSNRFAEGVGYVERGRAVAQAAELPLATVSLSRGLAWAYLLDGRFEEAASLMEWILAELDQTGHRDERTDLYLGSRWMRDAVRVYSDHPAEVVETATETYDLALEVSNRTVRSGTASLLATRHFLQGRYGEAERWAAEALEIGEAIGSVASVLTGASILALSRAARGEPFRGRRLVQAIEDAVTPGIAAQINVRFVVDALLAVGEQERALRIAEAAHRGASGRLRLMTAASALADALVASGRSPGDGVAAEYAFAIDTARAIGARSSLAGSLIGLARLHTRASRPDRAVPLLQEALEVCRALGLSHYERIADEMFREVRPSVPVSA